MTSRKKSQAALVRVESLILDVRGEKVILDSDLAVVYGVTTSRLNEQVKRNIDRFPEDFMFQLTSKEFINLISQIATSRVRHGGRRKLPCVFTEHGAIMAANVLNSSRAVRMGVFVVRAFVQLRKTYRANRELTRKLQELERRVEHHDVNLHALFEAIKRLMVPPEKPKRQIGFQVKESAMRYRAHMRLVSSHA
jgi:hypothetical protein